MKSVQTPAHDLVNPDLLATLPVVERFVEVGCSTGAMARAFRSRHPESQWLGIEIDPAYAEAARQHSHVLVGDVEHLLEDSNLDLLLRAECWVFGDTLEHLRDPWWVLQRVRKFLPLGGTVCACIPNAQHWSVQARLCLGQFVYEESGLLDRTHLRWFTPATMVGLFEDNGFKILCMKPRIFPHPSENIALAQIRAFAECLGGDPELAVRDARPFQVVVKAQKQ